MTDKLSERLEAAVERLYEGGMDTRGIADLFRESAELARRVEWQPIETASQAVDIGRPILLFSARWGVSVMPGGWDAHEKAWRVYGYGCPGAQPTHWMPLHEPPEVG